MVTILRNVRKSGTETSGQQMQHCLPQTPAGNCSGKPQEEILAQTQEMKEANLSMGTDSRKQTNKRSLMYCMHIGNEKPDCTRLSYGGCSYVTRHGCRPVSLWRSPNVQLSTRWQPSPATTQKNFSSCYMQLVTSLQHREIQRDWDGLHGNSNRLGQVPFPSDPGQPFYVPTRKTQ